MRPRIGKVDVRSSYRKALWLTVGVNAFVALTVLLAAPVHSNGRGQSVLGFLLGAGHIVCLPGLTVAEMLRLRPRHEWTGAGLAVAMGVNCVFYWVVGMIWWRGGSGVRVQGSGRAGSAPDAGSSSSSLNPEPRTLNPSVTIYTCGPEPMMKRVADIALRRGLACQIAVERAMACGMGTCQSCCIKVRKPDPSEPPLAGSDWCWRLACTDGPVFHARDLLW
jgi:hypothetical protein